MRKYSILCNPQVFKVYKDEAQKILVYEAQAIFSGAGLNPGEISFESIAGIWYLTFEVEGEPPSAFFKSLARHSAFYALFEKKGDMLLPKEADAGYIFKENMPSLLNYQGKTNALFTRLMLNLAKSVCRSDMDTKASVLDPVAGKGTTLYDALMLGYNAYGIELSAKYFEESCHYAAKFMQNEKFKHTTKKDKILDVKSRKISDAYTLEFAADKKSFAAKDTAIFKMFAGDTRIADRLIKKNSIDMIVGDLPYGIQHFNAKGAKKGAKRRDADDFFAEAFPSWNASLKKGGSLVVSFNEHTADKKNIAQVLINSGMNVLDDEKYDDYRHKVDSSIIRNLVVAVKPK